jgi:hypothetical protein
VTDAQREALEMLADNEWCYTQGRKTGLGAVNKKAAESLIADGLAQWVDEARWRVEITPAGRERMSKL